MKLIKITPIPWNFFTDPFLEETYWFFRIHWGYIFLDPINHCYYTHPTLFLQILRFIKKIQTKYVLRRDGLPKFEFSDYETDDNKIVSYFKECEKLEPVEPERTTRALRYDLDYPITPAQVIKVNTVR